ncbi:hypothetical protein [Phaeodactylibacter xiamenensis]|uniref:Uncharacterized protein n=1 Tax=Phaeodactylibacter xiamenensis TaxID=1524460 RepID=A0A098RZL4_9BACT|nr:hypothetical protein [Phaeodactylibacter xiamenensis]KGE85296.1 hypothetical protein IX84_27660 [Phaeodactylibacter xiamenensis]MCR9055183.1 hypothetical protein [bacterium]
MKKRTQPTIPRDAYIGLNTNSHIKDALVELAEQEGMTLTAYMQEVFKDHLRRKGIVIELNLKIV